MRTHSLTLAETIAEVEAVRETRGDAHAVVDNLANTLEELEALGDEAMRTRCLTLADKLGEVEAVGDTGGDKRSLVDFCADTL